MALLMTRDSVKDREPNAEFRSKYTWEPQPSLPSTCLGFNWDKPTHNVFSNESSWDCALLADSQKSLCTIMLIGTLHWAARALHTLFPTIKEPLQAGYYPPHGTDGNTETCGLLALTRIVSKKQRFHILGSLTWKTSLLVSTEEVLRDNGNPKQRSGVNGK